MDYSPNYFQRLKFDTRLSKEEESGLNGVRFQPILLSFISYLKNVDYIWSKFILQQLKLDTRLTKRKKTDPSRSVFNHNYQLSTNLKSHSLSSVSLPFFHTVQSAFPSPLTADIFSLILGKRVPQKLCPLPSPRVITRLG